MQLLSPVQIERVIDPIANERMVEHALLIGIVLQYLLR